MTAPFKKCGKCEKELLPVSFSKSSTSKDGLQGYCKICAAITSMAHVVAMEPHEHKHKAMLAGAKTRAKKKGIPFNLALKDIPMPSFCPALGLELSWTNTEQQDNSPTLDRINPSLGYVVGNIAVISRLANQIKTNTTADNIAKVAKWLKLQE